MKFPLPILLLAPIVLITLPLSTLTAREYWRHNEYQGDIGACHIFATVALIEAEYWRSTGQFIDLSERDLFLRHYSNGARSSSEIIADQLIAATQKKLPQNFNEAGNVDRDFDLAKKYGIASERELPYDSYFSTDIAMAVRSLRHNRDQLSLEANQLKRTKQWSSSVAQHKIQQSHDQLSRINKALALPHSTVTRGWTQKWLTGYQIKRVKPKTSSQAKSLIISRLAHRPVAVDLSNSTEIASNSQRFSTSYTRHSLVVSHYNPTTDQFTIRNSTRKGSTKVSADILSRGTYKLYYLEKK